MSKILYNILIWCIIMILCVMLIRNCQKRNDIEDINNHNIEALTDSIHYYKDAYGRECASKTILYGDINLLKKANDSLAKYVETLIKKPDHVVYIKNDIVREKKDTCWQKTPVDTVKHFDFSDKWRILEGNVSINKNDISLSIDKDIVYADFVIAVKDGRAYVSSSNPYVHTNDIEGYVLPKERKKWFHAGPCIGVGIGTDGKVRPYAGVSCILSLMSW